MLSSSARLPTLVLGKTTQTNFGLLSQSCLLGTAVYVYMTLCHTLTTMKVAHRVTVDITAEAPEVKGHILKAEHLQVLPAQLDS